MGTAMFVSLSLRLWQYLGSTGSVAPPFEGSGPVIFAKSALTTTLCTTVVALAVTLLTRAESEATLRSFYKKVRPDVRGWGPIAALEKQITPVRDLGRNLLAWVLGCGMVYLALFGAGKLIFRETGKGALMLVGSVVFAVLLYLDQSARGWGAEKVEPGAEPLPATPARFGH
jgi:hypothetical protein